MSGTKCSAYSWKQGDLSVWGLQGGNGFANRVKATPIPEDNVEIIWQCDLGQSPGKLLLSFTSELGPLSFLLDLKVLICYPSFQPTTRRLTFTFNEFLFYAQCVRFLPGRWYIATTSHCIVFTSFLSLSMYLSVCIPPPSDICINDWTHSLDPSLSVWFHMVGMSGTSGSLSAKEGSWTGESQRPSLGVCRSYVFSLVFLCSLYDLAF